MKPRCRATRAVLNSSTRLSYLSHSILRCRLTYGFAYGHTLSRIRFTPGHISDHQKAHRVVRLVGYPIPHILLKNLGILRFCLVFDTTHFSRKLTLSRRDLASRAVYYTTHTLIFMSNLQKSLRLSTQHIISYSYTNVNTNLFFLKCLYIILYLLISYSLYNHSLLFFFTYYYY